MGNNYDQLFKSTGLNHLLYVYTNGSNNHKLMLYVHMEKLCFKVMAYQKVSSMLDVAVLKVNLAVTKYQNLNKIFRY